MATYPAKGSNRLRCGAFPLAGPPRPYGLYDVPGHDMNSGPWPSEALGWGLEFANRSLTLVRPRGELPWILGFHGSANDAAEGLFIDQAVRIRYL